MAWRILAVGEHFTPESEVVRSLQARGALVTPLLGAGPGGWNLAAARAAVTPAGMLVGVQPVDAAAMAAAPALRVVAR